MNKGLIVVLAVCLVSVHAFVKREAPKAEDKPKIDLDAILKQAKDISEDIGNKIKEAWKPEQVKKGFEDMVAKIEKTVNDFQKTDQKAS